MQLARFDTASPHVVGDASASTLRPLAFVPPSGQIWRSYYYAGAQRIAMRVEGDSNPANNGLFYLLSDHLGSTRVVTGSNGQAVSLNSYYPFGASKYTSGARPTDMDFTGQRLDGTGLNFYNARYYDSAIGRFISADTVVPNFANSQSWNRFAYGYNNPLKFMDPTGHVADPKCEGQQTPDCGVDGWYGESSPGGDGSGPNFSITDATNNDERKEYSQTVLDALKNYSDPNVWWKSEGKLDVQRIKAWILEREAGDLWHLGYPAYEEPIGLMAIIINFLIGNKQPNAEDLALFTVVFDPKQDGQFDEKDWNLWLRTRKSITPQFSNQAQVQAVAVACGRIV